MHDTVLGCVAIWRGRAGRRSACSTNVWETVDAEQDPRLAAMICRRMMLHSPAQLRGTRMQWTDRATSLLESSGPSVVESFAIRRLGVAMAGHAEHARESYAELPESIRVGAQNQRVRMPEGRPALVLDEARKAFATVRYPLTRVYAKLGVRSRREPRPGTVPARHPGTAMRRRAVPAQFRDLETDAT